MCRIEEPVDSSLPFASQTSIMPLQLKQTGQETEPLCNAIDVGSEELIFVIRNSSAPCLQAES